MPDQPEPGRRSAGGSSPPPGIAPRLARRGASHRLRWAIAAIGIAAITVSMVGATLALAVDRDAFSGFGDALWWSVVTVATVGYGDVVPTNDAGRWVAGILIVFSMAFFPVLTGLVTAALVESRQREREAATDRDAAARHGALLDRLRAIEERLDRLDGS